MDCLALLVWENVLLFSFGTTIKVRGKGKGGEYREKERSEEDNRMNMIEKRERAREAGKEEERLRKERERREKRREERRGMNLQHNRQKLYLKNNIFRIFIPM